MKPLQTLELYHFGRFRLDAAEHRLWREDELISLTPKQFDLLFYFVKNAGRLAKKDELLNAVWSDTFVEETTLARNVSWLRKKLAEGMDSETYIETVPKLGYRFAAEVTRSTDHENVIVVEEQTIQYFRGEEIITIDDAPPETRNVEEIKRELETHQTITANTAAPRYSNFSLIFPLIALALVALAGSGFLLYHNDFEIVASTDGVNVVEKAAVKNIEIDAARNNLSNEIEVQSGEIINVSAVGDYQHGATERAAIKIGAIIHLRNQFSSEAGYLDAWGMVRNKPEFSIVPTELMFVSTHPNPNRDNGSGSWEIVSATAKKDGETLVYGDKIYLRNMSPDAGYLDNCGWLKDMPVFKDFRQTEKFAVFTAYSEDRDEGTGAWIINSDEKFAGDTVFEEDGIALENGFTSGGFLDTAGRVSDIPAFDDYDGLHLVFIHESSTNRRPNSGIWTISNSELVFK